MMLESALCNWCQYSRTPRRGITSFPWRFRLFHMKQIELVVHVPDDVRFMNATRGHAPREKDEYHNASKELLHVFPSVEQGDNSRLF